MGIEHKHKHGKVQHSEKWSELASYWRFRHQKMDNSVYYSGTKIKCCFNRKDGARTIWVQCSHWLNNIRLHRQLYHDNYLCLCSNHWCKREGSDVFYGQVQSDTKKICKVCFYCRWMPALEIVKKKIWKHYLPKKQKWIWRKTYQFLNDFIINSFPTSLYIMCTLSDGISKN